MKKCLYCAEKIQDDAVVCRYCGKEQPRPVMDKATLQKTNLTNFARGCLITAGTLVILIIIVWLAARFFVG